MTEYSEILNALNIEFYKSFDLSKASTFRVGGKADIAIFPKSENELVEAVSQAKKCGIRFEIIGNGSNVLFSDNGFKGAIIFTKNISDYSVNNNFIEASCGVKLSLLSNFACDNSLSGLEFSYGIPATVGGAVAMNAGAYGGQMSDVVVSSRAYDTSLNKIILLDKHEHKFDYRKSVFSANKNLICISSTFSLSRDNKDIIKARMKENLSERHSKQPVEFPNAGSFFKRPEGYFAAKLIDDCGLKGLSVGGAKVSEKHAGFIVNYNHATSRDIVLLGELVEKRVFEKFGVKLEREVKYIF